MHKLKILMLCFILSGALSYAHGEAKMENAKGEDIPIEVIEKARHGGEERGNYIISSVTTLMYHPVVVLQVVMSTPFGTMLKYPIVTVIGDKEIRPIQFRLTKNINHSMQENGLPSLAFFLLKLL